MTDTVLLIGGGGREHALSWKLAQSAKVKAVFVAPGNAGTSNNGKIDNVALDVKNFDAVADFCKDQHVDLVVVGPEDPLANGISDHLTKNGIACFGPSSKAAQIESSKQFAKEFMVRHSIPTAKFAVFTDAEKACAHINSVNYPALVVKASGLAAGKGVVVASARDQACQAVTDILKERSFGSAGDTVVIEELLEGEEVSCLAFSDGSTVAMLPPAQDHKRLCEKDEGPNTGGMGAFCPYPRLGMSDLEDIKTNILQKAVDGMKEEGMPYVGVLYAGLMITTDGPKVLEFNCRFGDPETQCILPLLKSDLYTICQSCVKGTLCENMPEFDSQNKVLGVVLVSDGYPGSYKKGLPISGIEEAEKLGVTVFHAGTAQKDGQMVTSGGRVLLVQAMDRELEAAAALAKKGAAVVKFDGAFYRTDIAFRVLNRSLHSPPTLTYKDSGVDITAGNDLVESIKPLSESTSRSGCVASLGSFGALFDLKAAGFADPILVSGTDGVGTKLKIAQTMDNHKTIGKDLVAMCVNDILAHGAEPLFFLDYLATGKLDVGAARDIVEGVAEGCRIAGCALVGGETAEMPGMYFKGEYDVAGFAVGAVERDKMLPRIQSIKPGDAVIGLSSSGLHSNGFSLVRKIIEKLGLKYDMPSPFKTGKKFGEDLLTPTKIYVSSVLPLMNAGKVKAFAHITGGGLLENIPRVLPDGLRVRLDAKQWKLPPVFGWLEDKGKIKEEEMARTFNCGIGGILIVDNSAANQIVAELHGRNEEAAVIGHVEQGTGTNLQALIDHTKDPVNQSAAEIILVISNKAGVKGLERAEKAGIATKVINHKDFGSREEFDEALHHSLTAAGVEIVCLAGFMRILSGKFVNKWAGHMLNVHPSLLPSFKGADAHKQVLASGVRLSGCTVHFVAEEVDAGAILVQESVPVYPGDTEESLQERVKQMEHQAFPRALELLASERAVLGENGTVDWRL